MRSHSHLIRSSSITYELCDGTIGLDNPSWVVVVNCAFFSVRCCSVLFCWRWESMSASADLRVWNMKVSSNEKSFVGTNALHILCFFFYLRYFFFRSISSLHRLFSSFSASVRTFFSSPFTFGPRRSRFVFIGTQQYTRYDVCRYRWAG